MRPDPCRSLVIFCSLPFGVIKNQENPTQWLLYISKKLSLSSYWIISHLIYPWLAPLSTLTLRALHHFFLSCSSFPFCPFDLNLLVFVGPTKISASAGLEDWIHQSQVAYTHFKILLHKTELYQLHIFKFVLYLVILDFLFLLLIVINLYF